jgi:hypothetical protein
MFAWKTEHSLLCRRWGEVSEEDVSKQAPRNI